MKYKSGIFLGVIGCALIGGLLIWLKWSVPKQSPVVAFDRQAAAHSKLNRSGFPGVTAVKKPQHLLAQVLGQTQPFRAISPPKGLSMADIGQHDFLKHA